MKNGLEPAENKNVNVTLELLQTMDYEDIAEKDKDDFRPELVMNDDEIHSGSDETESVFNYLFPNGLKKKHDKNKTKSISKNKYSAKVYELKKKNKLAAKTVNNSLVKPGGK